MLNLGTTYLQKMRVEHASPVRYYLDLQGEELCVNDLLGKRLAIHYSGKIRCCHCHRSTRKSFNQGYCYPCFQKLAQCDRCIVSPEKCHYSQGTCREPAWGETHCMTDHIVYLANSSGIKVGITRASQIPTRWIDQGATQAIPVYRVPSRYLSGLIEVIYKSRVADRTSWQAMLKGNAGPVDMFSLRKTLHDALHEQVAALDADGVAWLGDEPAVRIDYPVQNWPAKVVSLNLDKTAEIEGRLEGIKGQYLILDTGCINIRKFGSYQVEVFAEA